MGFSPRDVDDMSLWQFAACADGYAKSQGADGDDPLSADDIASLSAYLDEPPMWVS